MRLGQGPAAPLTHGNKHLPHISRQEPDATTMPRYIVHVQVLHRRSEWHIHMQRSWQYDNRGPPGSGLHKETHLLFKYYVSRLGGGGPKSVKRNVNVILPEPSGPPPPINSRPVLGILGGYALVGMQTRPNIIRTPTLPFIIWLLFESIPKSFPSWTSFSCTRLTPWCLFF